MATAFSFPDVARGSIDSTLEYRQSDLINDIAEHDDDPTPIPNHDDENVRLLPGGGPGSTPVAEIIVTPSSLDSVEVSGSPKNGSSVASQQHRRRSIPRVIVEENSSGGSSSMSGGENEFVANKSGVRRTASSPVSGHPPSHFARHMP